MPSGLCLRKARQASHTCFLHGTCRYYRIISVRQKRGFGSHGHWVHYRSHGVSEKILSLLCIRYLTEPFQGLSTFFLYKILFDISTLIKKQLKESLYPLSPNQIEENSSVI